MRYGFGSPVVTIEANCVLVHSSWPNCLGHWPSSQTWSMSSQNSPAYLARGWARLVCPSAVLSGNASGLDAFRVQFGGIAPQRSTGKLHRKKHICTLCVSSRFAQFFQIASCCFSECIVAHCSCQSSTPQKTAVCEAKHKTAVLRTFIEKTTVND